MREARGPARVSVVSWHRRLLSASLTTTGELCYLRKTKDVLRDDAHVLVHALKELGTATRGQLDLDFGLGFSGVVYIIDGTPSLDRSTFSNVSAFGCLESQPFYL